jgi:hypothetical protein
MFAPMSSDLIAPVVAVALATAVVVLGLRRNLSDTTRNELPRFGDEPEQPTANLGLYKGEAVRGRRLSPRQRRRLVPFYLLLALFYAALAVLSANDRLLHAVSAGLWVFGAGFLIWQWSRQRPDGSSSSRVP